MFFHPNQLGNRKNIKNSKIFTEQKLLHHEDVLSRVCKSRTIEIGLQNKEKAIVPSLLASGWCDIFLQTAEGVLSVNELWIYRQGFLQNNFLTGIIEQLIKNSKQGLHRSPVYRKDKIALFFMWLSQYYGWFSLSPTDSLTWRMVISLEFLQLIW